MGIVRVAQVNPGRLVRVSLGQVDEPQRRRAATRLRDQRWERELRPDVGYMPSMRQRLNALWDAVQMERAVAYPSTRRYYVPAAEVERVIP